MKKFDKFKYQPVESTHKGFYEILVTFEYRGKACHYYSFIKEKAKASKKYYLDEAKNEVDKMIKNGQLEKRAKRYLNYKLKDEDKLVVKTSNPRFATMSTNGKTIVQTKTVFRKPSALFVHVLISIIAVLFIAAGAYSIIRAISLGNWPDYVLEPIDKFKITIHLYTGIALAAVGLAGAVFSTILHIRRIKRK